MVAFTSQIIGGRAGGARRVETILELILEEGINGCGGCFHSNAEGESLVYSNVLKYIKIPSTTREREFVWWHQLR